MSNEWNWHVNSLQTRLNDLQSTIDSIKACVERRPGLDSATKAIAALIEPSSQSEFALQEFPMALSICLADPAIGSLLVGPKGEVVLYNATAEVLLGREYMQDRSVAGHTNTIQFSTEDRSRRFNPDELPWNRALLGETLPEVRLHVNKNASPEAWINVSATPFRSAQGSVTGAVVFLIDTTEEVQLEGSITTLCDTIHSQIAQVGNTHDQLRDLADRLSNTGIQRILADIGGTQSSPPREEDPNRKKSVPRRDATASTARETALPKPVQLKHKEPLAVATPPLPKALSGGDEETQQRMFSPDADQAESGTWAQVDSSAEPPFEWPPAPKTIAPADALQIQPPAESRSLSISGSQTAEAEPLPPQAEDASVYTIYQPEVSDLLEVSPLQPDDISGIIADEESTERTADPSNHDNRFGEATLEANPIDINEARKLLEAEATDALVAQPVVDEPSRQPDPAVDQLPDTSIVEPVQPQAPSWSTEYAPIETPAALRVTDQEATPAKPASASDEVVDSAKSLFGKFANLTKDSAYGDNKTDEKEPDPALPWPELVDGMDYGNPLWDEYTQSEEESTPWQQDSEEAAEDGISTVAANAVVDEASVDYSALPPVDQDPFAPIESYEQDYAPVDTTPQEFQQEDYAQYAQPEVRKPRPSASYNKLKPLSAAAEGYQEPLTEPVVSYEEESVEVEERPRRVLVVDDIPVNQKLLLLHLKRLGFEADVASNGQEALDMLSTANYQLVLMDCDMPVMDGFEAASRIRNNEAYTHGRIPIIALTSYDREGDKEKCIASGMDDYITKGASQKELKETIDRAFASMNQQAQAAPEVGVTDDSELSPPDIAAMLRLYGREEVEEVSRLFLSNMGTYIECMQLSIDEKNPDSVVHFANAVKGPCAALGMRLMTRLTTDIMAYAEAQDWTQVRVKYMRLKAVFVQTREELRKVCPDDSLLAT